MEHSRLTVAAEIVGIVAILATFVLILLQKRQAELKVSAEFNVSLVTAGIETASLISDNSKTWAKGSAGEEMDRAEQAIFESIAANLDTRWFVEHRHMIRLGETDQAEAILHDWATYLHARPGLRYVWSAQQRRISETRNLLSEKGDRFNYWSEAIRADLVKLDKALE